MTTTKAFRLPTPCGMKTPLSQLHVWQWADKQPNRRDVHLTNYLTSIGFTIGVDRLTKDKYELLRLAIEEWHRCGPIIRTPKFFEEVFDTTGGPFSFYEKNHKGCKVGLLESTRAALQECWIYQLHPDNCYFELINGKVWAKYNQILGSKPLVVLK